jgi:hypothetical protein
MSRANSCRRKLLEQPPMVIRRYIQQRIYLRLASIERPLIRLVLRPRLQWAERPRRKALDEALNTVAREASRSRRLNFTALSTVTNLALYYLTAERDIQTMKIDALTHHDSWRRSLCLRVILMTIHELDMDKVAGRKLETAMEDAKVPEELRTEIHACLRAVRTAQKAARDHYSALRNATIAHRDDDALRQYRAMVDLDDPRILDPTLRFYTSMQALVAILPKLVESVGCMRGLLSQYSSQTRRKSSINMEKHLNKNR